MRVPPIVTITVNPCVDESADVERVVPDRKLRCGAPRYEPGGGGINVARAVHRLGGDALAIYPAGGPAGDLLRTLLADEGVPQRAIPIAAGHVRTSTSSRSSTGRQFRFVLPGPGLAPAEREALFAEVSGLRPFPPYLVASGSLPPGFPSDYLAKLARLARERGARFVLDGSGRTGATGARGRRLPRQAEPFRVPASQRSRRHRRSQSRSRGAALDRAEALRGRRRLPRGRRCPLRELRFGRTVAWRRSCPFGARWEPATRCWPGSSWASTAGVRFRTPCDSGSQRARPRS